MDGIPPFDGIVQLPWNVGSAEDQDASVVVADPIHLHQKFCLDSP